MLGASFALALLGLSAAAQTGIGTGTTAPRTMLDVNGAISVAEGTVDVTSNAATIPAAFTFVRLTGTPTGAITLTAATGIVPGQLLTIFNPSAQNATFGGQTILAGMALNMVFSNTAFQATTNGSNALTSSNGLTRTSSNFTLGGTLTAATAIAQGGNTFSLTGGNVGIGSTAAATTALTIAQQSGNTSVVRVSGGAGSSNDLMQLSTANCGPACSQLNARGLVLNNINGTDATGNQFGDINFVSTTTVTDAEAVKINGIERDIPNASGGLEILTRDIPVASGGTGGTTLLSRLRISKLGQIRIGSLAGTGTRTVVTDATGNLSTATAASLDPTTASNGLTKTSSNFVLGGALTQATAIPLGNNNITFSTGTTGTGVLIIDGQGIAGSTTNTAKQHIEFTSNSDPNAVIGHTVASGTAETNDLFFYVGNDAVPTAGPDRIRMVRENILFQSFNNSANSTIANAEGNLSTVTNMFISTDGKVGIGTSTPNTNLEVAGSVRLDALAGTGSRTVVADASGNLSAAAGAASSPYFASGITVTFDPGGATGTGTSTPTNAVNSTVNIINNGNGSDSIVVTFTTAAPTANYEISSSLSGTATNSLAYPIVTNKTVNGYTISFWETVGTGQTVNYDYTVRLR